MNLVVWLVKSPILPQMIKALQSVEFREKVWWYINMVAREEPSMEEEVCEWKWQHADELQQHSCSTYCSHHKCGDQCPMSNATTIHQNGAWGLTRSTSAYNMYCPFISQALGVRQCLYCFTNRLGTMQDISCLGSYLSAHTISLVDTSITISAVLGNMCWNYFGPNWLDQCSHFTWLLGAVMIAITQMNKICTEMKVISLMRSNDHLSSHSSTMINCHILEKNLLFNYEEVQTWVLIDYMDNFYLQLTDRNTWKNKYAAIWGV
jgi:hypothetical protein